MFKKVGIRKMTSVAFLEVLFRYVKKQVVLMILVLC
jgi:hypothetical protein